MVESVRTRLSIPVASNDTLDAYAEFKERASFGDFLFLNERLITNPEDSRTLAYVASNELGMLMGPVANTIIPRYAALGSIHMHLKQIEVLQKEEESPLYFGTLAMAVQGLCGVMLGYTLLNNSLSDEERVQYTVPEFQFIRAHQIDDPDGFGRQYRSLLQDLRTCKDEEFVPEPKMLESTPGKMMDMVAFEPPALGMYLKALNAHDPGVYLRFLNGFVKYADYLLETAATRKIGELPLRDIVRDPLIAIVDEYLGAAQDQHNTNAEAKLTNLMKDIISGQAYKYQ